MILEEYIIVRWHSKNRDVLEINGYTFTEYGEEIKVSPLDLPKNSNFRINAMCDVDGCDCVTNMTIQNYNKYTKWDGKYRCKSHTIEKQNAIVFEKYGVTSVLYLRDLMEAKMMEKYGVRNISLLDNWDEIMKDACQKKYGVDNVFQLDEVKEKSMQTSIEKYGVEYHFQNKDEKIKWLIGDKNSQWAGGHNYDERRYSGLNRQWRIEVYERDNYACQVCGDNKGGNLVAHHLNSYDINVEERYNLDNGITLCSDCHKEFHIQYKYGENNKNQFNEFLKVKRLSKQDE